ncbi:MAG: sigma-70 family RNA polymerase sigma factor [Cyanobacteriota bacterium]
MLQAKCNIQEREVLKHSRLAYRCAHDIAKRTFIPYEDLAQVALEALIGCVQRFDKTRGCTFSTFAMQAIKGRLLNYVRDSSTVVRIPRPDYDLWQKARRTERTLKTELKRTPKPSEVASRLNITVERYREIVQTMQYCRYLKGETVLDVVDGGANNHYSQATQDALKADLTTVDELARQAVELYLVQDKTLVQTASLMGISQSSVIELVRQGLAQAELKVAA